MKDTTDANKTRIFLMDDADLVKKYLKFVKKHNSECKRCIKEVTAETGHQPALFDDGDNAYMAGIVLTPASYDFDKDKAEVIAQRKADAVANGEDPDRVSTYYYSSGVAKTPPPGWRKRVKDDFFCPLLKGGGPEAEAARALMSKWKKIQGPRDYLRENYGIKTRVFAGLSLVTIGIDILDKESEAPKLYVITRGPEQNCTGPHCAEPATHFTEIKHSEYLVAKGE